MISKNEHHHARAMQERERAAKSDDVAVRRVHLELARLHDLAEKQALHEFSNAGIPISVAEAAKPFIGRH